MSKQYDLTQEELHIQAEGDACLLKNKHILGKNQQDTILHITNQAQKRLHTNKKSKSITLRIAEPDLISIKAQAIKLGIPYQTLIGSRLHQHAS